MTTFKKMVLLSQDELERMKAKQIKEYDPSLQALARIQDQLDTVLNDSSIAKLPPDERLKLFQKLQHRFTQIKNEGDTPLKLAGISSNLPEPAVPPVIAAGAAAAQSPPPRLPVQLVGVNKRYRTHASELMKHILQYPNLLSVNDRMEIVVKGHTVPGSNILDLVSDTFATAKSRVDGPRPPGFREFITGLKEVNAPRTLLINPEYAHSLSSPAAALSASSSMSSPSNPFSHPTPFKSQSSLRVKKFSKSSHRKYPNVLSLYKV